MTDKDIETIETIETTEPEAVDQGGPQSDAGLSATNDRLGGNTLRLRRVSNESTNNYTPFLRSLQIKSSQQQRFLTGVLVVIRQKHLTDLKRGTEAGVRQLTTLLLRGFGNIVWTKNATEWLIEDEELDEGEERLIYKRAGEHDRFKQ